MTNMEAKVRDLLEQVERREKSLELHIESAWSEINRKDANTAILEWYTKEIHDSEIIMNEVVLMKREIEKILQDDIM